MSGPDDDVVEPAVARWWNRLAIEERCYWLGFSRSMDPTKAYHACQGALARAEEVRDAERAHADITQRAKVASLVAEALRGGNGAVSEH